MRLKHQVIGLLAVLIGLLLIVSVVSYTGSSRTTSALGNVADWYVPINTRIADVTKVQLTSSLALQTVLNSQDVDEIEAAETRFATTNEQVESGLAAAIEQLDQAKAAIASEETSAFLDSVEGQVIAAQDAFATFQSNATGLVESLNSGDLSAAFEQMSSAQEAESAMLAALDEAYQAISAFTEQTATGARADAGSTLNFLMFLSIAAVVLSIVLGWFGLRRLMQNLGRDPREIQQLGKAIADGKLEEGGDVDKEEGIYASLLTMRDQLRERIEAERKQNSANLRIKVALDNVSTNIMVTDGKHDIIYINDAMEENFTRHQNAIRRDLPNFSCDQLVGGSIHLFYSDPAHIRRVLEGLKDGDVHEDTVKIGGRHYDLSASPVIDDDGEALGFVVEWNDRTIEVGIEQEVASIVRRAEAGDFSRRADTEGKTGFFLNLAKGLNGLIESTESAIKDTARVLAALAKGDLSQSIDKDYEGLFAELKRDANATTEKLRDVIAQIQEASESVRTGAEEISQGNHSLSSRTEQQAASLEETASSMEQMTATVRQSADQAKHANQLAISASDKAESGGAVVQNAVTAMGEINDSSRKIADITSVIDSIAFQTNLLALNAAVEAARAGEQGRGFAVVASEVRNLAQRSATAAREINELIATSVEKIEAGSKLVNQSGETLSEIVDAVKRVADMIAEISAASEEQTQGIEEVNRAVTQMDEMTQQNAALVEEAAAASQNMGVQARDLSDLVGFFSGLPNRAGSRSAGTAESKRPEQPKAPPKALPDNAAEKPEQKAGAKPASDTSGDRKARAADAPPTSSGDDDDEWDEF